MSKRGIKGFALLLLSGLMLVCEVGVGANWSFRDPHDAVPHNAEEYEWEEERIQLPPFPKDEDLLEIRFRRPEARFRYYIDPGSLSVGDDGVVRYVVRLDSANGAKNVMYEGIRCNEYDYKTFAYGNRRGEFSLLRNPQWREISDRGNNWFRHDLWKQYLCISGNTLVPRTEEEILRDIRYFRDKGQGRE